MTQDPTRQATDEITCQEVAEWTSAYLDAHAGEKRNVGIALHLGTCAGCKAYVKQIVTVKGLVRLLPKEGNKPVDLSRLRHMFAVQFQEHLERPQIS